MHPQASDKAEAHTADDVLRRKTAHDRQREADAGRVDGHLAEAMTHAAVVFVSHDEVWRLAVPAEDLLEGCGQRAERIALEVEAHALSAVRGRHVQVRELLLLVLVLLGPAKQLRAQLQ